MKTRKKRLSNAAKNSSEEGLEYIREQLSADDRPMTLGRTLRLMRQTRGFTLQRLADETGTNVGNLSRIERDLSKPGLDLLHRLADAMDYSLAAIFSFGELGAQLHEQKATLLATFLTLDQRERELLLDIANVMSKRLSRN